MLRNNFCETAWNLIFQYYQLHTCVCVFYRHSYGNIYVLDERGVPLEFFLEGREQQVSQTRGGTRNFKQTYYFKAPKNVLSDRIGVFRIEEYLVKKWIVCC
jgi:hypothetical protein